MSLHDPAGQTNPVEEPDFALEELKQKVSRTVTVLDDNRKGIIRWFCWSLLAFNLALWSVALPIIAVVLLRMNAA